MNKYFFITQLAYLLILHINRLQFHDIVNNKIKDLF